MRGGGGSKRRRGWRIEGLEGDGERARRGRKGEREGGREEERERGREEKYTSEPFGRRKRRAVAVVSSQAVKGTCL